ncbi:MAG: hypothetical protein GC201_11045 [Alphaproteobacteria bacterium]|nr:hypothetical protein [Alphaproteobacteria bacterium]
MWLMLLRWAGAHRVALGAGAAVVALAGLGWGLWAVREAGFEAGRAMVQARWDESVRREEARARAEERLVQRAVDAIGARLTIDLARIRTRSAIITKRIEDEVQRFPVYRECRLTDGVWRQLNQLHAATGAVAAGGGGAAVPEAGADP